MFTRIIFSSDAKGNMDIRIEKDGPRDFVASCDRLAAWCMRTARQLAADGELFGDPEGRTDPASITFSDDQADARGITVDLGDGVKDGEPVSLGQQMAINVVNKLLDEMACSAEQETD